MVVGMDTYWSELELDFQPYLTLDVKKLTMNRIFNITSGFLLALKYMSIIVFKTSVVDTHRYLSINLDTRTAPEYVSPYLHNVPRPNYVTRVLFDPR